MLTKYEVAHWSEEKLQTKLLLTVKQCPQGLPKKLFHVEDMYDIRQYVTSIFYIIQKGMKGSLTKNQIFKRSNSHNELSTTL
jgi:hypothetical protein